MVLLVLCTLFIWRSTEQVRAWHAASPPARLRRNIVGGTRGEASAKELRRLMAALTERQASSLAYVLNRIAVSDLTLHKQSMQYDALRDDTHSLREELQQATTEMKTQTERATGRLQDLKQLMRRVPDLLEAVESDSRLSVVDIEKRLRVLELTRSTMLSKAEAVQDAAPRKSRIGGGGHRSSHSRESGGGGLGASALSSDTSSDGSDLNALGFASERQPNEISAGIASLVDVASAVAQAFTSTSSEDRRTARAARAGRTARTAGGGKDPPAVAVERPGDRPQTPPVQEEPSPLSPARSPGDLPQVPLLVADEAQEVVVDAPALDFRRRLDAAVLDATTATELSTLDDAVELTNLDAVKLQRAATTNSTARAMTRARAELELLSSSTRPIRGPFVDDDVFETVVAGMFNTTMYLDDGEDRVADGKVCGGSRSGSGGGGGESLRGGVAPQSVAQAMALGQAALLDEQFATALACFRFATSFEEVEEEEGGASYTEEQRTS